MPGVIEFQNVTVGYRRPRCVVLSGLSFSIFEGEFFGIVGANGSGKTTLLRAMLGVLPPLDGEILCRVSGLEAGQGVSEGRRVVVGAGVAGLSFGYVPQRDTIDEIYPLTVREVTLMGRYGALAATDRPSGRDHRLVESCLEQVGAAELAERSYRDLSGGQKQRVLIARALAAQTRVLALDEPTTGMDLEGECAVMELVRRLQAESGVTVVLVSHRLDLLANAAQRLMLLHEGKVRIGTVGELLAAPILREVYGVEARVELVNGKRVVLT
jgi:ABC-type cobalamin/Fe3+-siderophores transport system ATPase subunit